MTEHLTSTSTSSPSPGPITQRLLSDQAGTLAAEGTAVPEGGDDLGRGEYRAGGDAVEPLMLVTNLTDEALCGVCGGGMEQPPLP